MNKKIEIELHEEDNVKLELTREQAHQINRLSIHLRQSTEKTLLEIIEKVTDKLSNDDYEALKELGIKIVAETDN